MKKFILILLSIFLFFNLIAVGYILLCHRFSYYSVSENFFAAGLDHKRIDRITGIVEYHYFSWNFSSKYKPKDRTISKAGWVRLFEVPSGRWEEVK